MQPMMEKYGLSKEEALNVLSKCKDGVVATNGADGFPYGTPVNYIYLDGVIYFHGRAAGEKVDNITRDNRVCFTVYGHESFEITGPQPCNVTTDYTCVIVRGKCTPVTEQSEKERILFEMIKKLTPVKATGPVDPANAARTGIYAISMDSVTGKRHPAMPGNKTF